MKKQKKFDKYAKRRLIALLFIIILVLIIIINSKKNKIVYENYRILLGNQYVDLKNEIIVDDDKNVYLSKEDIMDLYDSNLLYDQTENKIITTYNKHIAILTLDDPIIKINGSDIKSKASLIKINDKLYLPFSELGIVYDLEITYCDTTKTAIVYSISEEKNEASVKSKKSKIKQQPKSFSSKIEKISKDQRVVILEETKKYYKVVTESGNIGYIKKSKLNGIEKIRDNMENSKLDNLNIVENLDLIEENTNAIIIDTFNIKNSEIISNLENINKEKQLKNEDDLKMFARLTCEDDMDKLLLTFEKREQVINNLYNLLILNNITGICIDFNKINDVNSFYRFLIELSPKLRESGIKIIVKSNEILKEDKLNSIVDYVLVKE